MKRTFQWIAGLALFVALVGGGIYLLRPHMPCDANAVMVKGTNAECAKP